MTRIGSPRACSRSSVSRMTDRCGGTNGIRRRRPQSPRATAGARSLRLDGDLVAKIFDVAVQDVSHVLHGRAERETASWLRQVDCWPRPFVLGVHGSRSHVRGLNTTGTYIFTPSATGCPCGTGTFRSHCSPGGLLAPPGVPAGMRSGFGLRVAPPFAPYGHPAPVRRSELARWWSSETIAILKGVLEEAWSCLPAGQTDVTQSLLAERI